MAVRLKEIDALRGLAVVLMIGYHALFDAKLFGLVDLDLSALPVLIFLRMGQFLFLGLVGVSVYLSSRGFLHQCKRGLWIFFWGMVITVISWVLFEENYVRFGVLHFIGVSVPVVVLFKKRPNLALLFAPIFFGMGKFFQTFTVGESWWIPFGVRPAVFSTFDYFPLFPWLAVPLVGLWLASKIYARREATALVFLSRVPGFCFLGRHSLAVYLLHLPLVYFSLWGLFYLLNS